MTLKTRLKVRELIESAEAICYPMGSFYSSLIASLLPTGVGETISGMSVPKVYIPNRGVDPEQLGMTLTRSVKTLIRYLRSECPKRVTATDLLQYVLLDVRGGGYGAGELDSVRKLGVEIVDVPLMTEESEPYWDADRLGEVLVSLV